MSGRQEIFWHRDEVNHITIEVYEELIRTNLPQDTRIEIVFPHGRVNVPWPKDLPADEVAALSIKTREPDEF